MRNRRDFGATREIVGNYFFRRYALSALSRVRLKLVSDDIAFRRGPGNVRESTREGEDGERGYHRRDVHGSKWIESF